MEKNIEHFLPMGTEELLETNGGGFAYDVGRILRFIGNALPGDFASVAYANADWYATTLMNEAKEN